MLMSEVDAGPRADVGKADDLVEMERNIRRLQEQAKDLNQARHALEGDVRALRKKATRLEDEIAHLKSPPMIIGTLQDMLGPRTAIVKSSNGPSSKWPSTNGSLRTNFGRALALR